MSVDQISDSSNGFSGLGLPDALVETLTSLGYEEPTPIQVQAIPLLLEGRDLVGQAATGTGKTAAFALPMVARLASERRAGGRPSALVLVPTRELAMQVAEAVHRYGRAFDVNVLPIYGGQPFGQQLRVLKRGVDVVVATPGRALDHINRGTLALDAIRSLVLDEADEMLDMGFADDLEAIFAAIPADRQTILFSATMPPRIAAVAKRHLRDPARIRIAQAPLAAGEAPQVRQMAYVVPRAHKQAALARVLDLENPDAALVFCRTRTEVDQLTETLIAHGYLAEALHGGMNQEQRDRVMKKLRGGTADLLIATDLAGRGLDISRLTHVINYDVPNAPEAYVHRIGRVGRAGREGVAITLAEPREHRLLRSIEQLTKQKIEIGRVPTVADLKARRLELLRASLRETLLEDELDSCRVVVESLASEFDPMDIAAAAVKLAREATAGEREPEDVEIPDVTPRREQREGGSREFGGKEGSRGRGAYAGRGEGRGRGSVDDPTDRRSRADDRSPRKERQGAEGEGRRVAPVPGRRVAARDRGGPKGGMVRLYVGAGRDAGVRPQDLVGAITGEAGISGRDIGTINITDGFSVVEVAEGVAGEVIEAMRGSKLKGRKVGVRRFE